MAAAARIPQWQDSSVRILAQDAKSPLFIATPAVTGLDEIATRTFRDTPARIASLAQQIVHVLDPDATPALGLSETDADLARQIAQALKSAERPLIVSGTGCGSVEVLQAAANVCTALAKAGKSPQISLVFADSNSVGTTLMGGGTLDAVLTRVQSSEVDTLIVLENDLLRHISAGSTEAALAMMPNTIVLDCDQHGSDGPRRFAAAGRQFRRIRRHAGQQRRPCTTLLPDVRAERLRHPGILALVAADRAGGRQGSGRRPRRAHRRLRRGATETGGHRRVPPRRRSSASRARRFRASLTATAAAPRWMLRPTCTSRVRRRTATPHWRSRWRARAAICRPQKFRSSGPRAGTRRRR